MDESPGLEMFNRDGSSVEMIGAEHSPGAWRSINGTLGIGLSTAAGPRPSGAGGAASPGQVLRLHVGRRGAGGGPDLGRVRAGGRGRLRITRIDNLWAADGRQRPAVRRGHVERHGGRRHRREVPLLRCDLAWRSTPTILARFARRRRTPHEGRPLIILARSSPTQGMSFLRRRFPRLHYVRFKSPEERDEMNLSIAAELGGIDPVDLASEVALTWPSMVNRAYAAAFEKHALTNPDVLCLSADLTSSCEIDGFRDPSSRPLRSPSAWPNKT